MRLLSLLALTFAVVLGVCFAILNSKTVAFNYFFGEKFIPLSILLLGTFILGIVIGLFISWCKILKLKMELRHLHKTGVMKIQ